MIDSELDWLALFAPNLAIVVAVLEQEHITRAAAQLGISQPTVTRALHRVEAELDVALVRPAGRGIARTAAGSALLPLAQQALAALRLTRSGFADVIDPDRGQISLAFLHTLGVQDVPRLIDGFRASYPDVRYGLTQGSAEEIRRQLHAGTIDVLITAPLPLERPGFASLALREEPLDLFVPADHRLAARTGIDLHAVRAENFIAMTPGHGLRQIFDEVCAKAGFTPRIEFLGEDVATLRGLVGAGLGVAVLPRAHGTPGAAVGIPIRRPRARRVVGAVWPTDRQLSPAARRFISYLQEHGRTVLHEP